MLPYEQLVMFWSFNVLQELRERVLRGKYRIPFYMSTDCENLLKKFLILNPLKRYTLEVRFHLFLKQNSFAFLNIEIVAFEIY